MTFEEAEEDSEVISTNENNMNETYDMDKQTQSSTYYVPKMVECMFYTLVKRRDDNGWARCMSTSKNYKSAMDNQFENMTHFVMVARNNAAISKVPSSENSTGTSKSTDKKDGNKKERFEKQKSKNGKHFKPKKPAKMRFASNFWV